MYNVYTVQSIDQFFDVDMVPLFMMMMGIKMCTMCIVNMIWQSV